MALGDYVNNNGKLAVQIETDKPPANAVAIAGIGGKAQIIDGALKVTPVNSTSSYGNYPERDWLLNTGTGTTDNSILFTATSMTPYQKHVIHCTAGTVDVEVSLNGTTWTSSATNPMAMLDMNATASNTYVLTVASGKVALLEGKFASIRVLQNGATAATASMGSYS